MLKITFHQKVIHPQLFLSFYHSFYSVVCLLCLCVTFYCCLKNSYLFSFHAIDVIRQMKGFTLKTLNIKIFPPIRPNQTRTEPKLVSSIEVGFTLDRISLWYGLPVGLHLYITNIPLNIQTFVINQIMSTVQVNYCYFFYSLHAQKQTATVHLTDH